jgi:hypothetical protein
MSAPLFINVPLSMSFKSGLFLLGLLFACLLMGVGVYAAKSGDLLGPLPKVLVDKIKLEARLDLHKGKLPNGRFVPRESLIQQSKPLLPDPVIRQAVERGRTTAVARLCGLDWVNLSFKPFMASHRATHRYTDKQLVYLAALHGTAQGIFEEAFRQQRAVGCTATMKLNVKNALK